MPNMSGETAMAKLKQNPSFHIPVIALTADAIAGAKEKYVSEGFVDYIAKPFTKEQIKEKLDKIFVHNASSIVDIPLEPQTSNEIYDENYLLSNGINYKKGLELLGDIDTYKNMLSDWFKECHQKFEDMKLFKLKHDMQNYAIRVHALKSDSKYFGLDKLAEMAYEHEIKSKANDEQYVKDNFEKLEREFIRTTLIIEKYVKD